MKPRRKGPCLSATSNGVALAISEKPPTNERKRSDVASPGRRKSSLGESVCPPPEYFQFDFENNCPKFIELARKDDDEYQLHSKELTQLQFELEALLGYSADCHLRAVGEVTFLTSGDYPTMDLENRPMPTYKLREIIETSPIPVIDDGQGICGLPADHINDDIDIWPPHHIPTRFWKWCMEDSLKPIDIQFLKDFKKLIMNTVSPEVFHQLYINEPWKYRKKPAGRTRLLSNGSSSGNSSNKRRMSFGSEERKKVCPLSKKKCMRDRVIPCIANLVDVVCREILESEEARRINGIEKQENDIESDETPKRGVLLECEGDERICSDNENAKSCMDQDGLSCNVKNENPSNGEFDDDLPCCSTNGSHSLDTSPKRRNGEILHNGFHMNGEYLALTEENEEKLNGYHEDGCSGDCADDLKTYNSIGEEILEQLINKDLIPEYSAVVFNHMLDYESEVGISTEGKEECDDEELDEVSEELHRCQQELKELEPDVCGITEYAWLRLISDFSFWETAGQLDDVDNTLFRLAVNTYREFPRRFPTPAEWPSIVAAIKRRNEKARLFYGRFYKKAPDYYEEGAPEVENPVGF